MTPRPAPATHHPRAAPPTRLDALILDLCGTGDAPLATPLRAWCLQSRPLTAFLDAHRSKVRRKVRLATTPDSQGDLLAELFIAALLLGRPAFGVHYEPRRTAGQRSPDLEALYRAHTRMPVEVTRLHAPAPDAASADLRLARVLSGKVNQFPAGEHNLLAVVVPPGPPPDGLIAGAVRLLERAPGSQAALRPEAVRAYHSGRARLSAVAVVTVTADWTFSESALWLNPLARHPLPAPLNRDLRAVLTALAPQ